MNGHVGLSLDPLGTRVMRSHRNAELTNQQPGVGGVNYGLNA